MATRAMRKRGQKQAHPQRSQDKTIVIRDPVHGYLRIAPHERTIVGHPVTQRLRHILQTGLAHLIFPEARTSRFVHSLGAMHLASRFLVACIENADPKVATAFFDALEALPFFKQMVKPADFDVLWSPEVPGTQTGLLASRAVFSGRLTPDDERRRRQLLACAEAGLRLAALFHDLGHLPFSHDLEYALKTYAKKSLRQGTKLPPGVEHVLKNDKVPPHEEIGHQLSKLVFSSMIQSDTSPAKRAVYALAQEILDAQPPYEDKQRPRATVLEWMHSLIDGEVDVDRGDYLLRDGRALGFEFAAYDLERLIDNLVLVQSPGDLGFATAIREAGLSALETFFLSRGRSNQAMVRHHKNAQAGAAFRHASVEAFKLDSGKALLEAIGALFDPALSKAGQGKILEVLGRFSEFDDSYWMQTLRELRREKNTPLVEACLDLVLDRGTRLKSLWKRKGDVPRERVIRLNDVLASDEPGTQAELAKRQDALEQRGVLLITHKFKPYRIFKARPEPEEERRTASLMLVQTDERGLESAARLSPLIQALQRAWDDEPHLHAFVRQGVADTVEPLQVIDQLIDGLPLKPDGRATKALTRATARGRKRAATRQTGG
jgi:HD superfamily phosphohydrolase